MASVFAILSCSKDGNGGGDQNLPSEQTQVAFKADYPNATNVTWSKKNGYDVVAFDLKKKSETPSPKQNKAWYIWSEK